MLQIERDETLKAYEIFDENNEESIVITDFNRYPLIASNKYKIVGITANDMGTPVNKFTIMDSLLKELAKKRGWIKDD